MGMKGHGTYAKLWQDVWRHPKTFRLAKSIAALGYPERAAKREAVGQLHELLCWCIAESDDGQIAHLPPTEFARVVGWDDPRKAPQLLEAWKDSGFLDVIGPDDVRVHDFTDAAKELLYKRSLRRPEGGRPDADTDGQGTDNGRPPGAQRAPKGRTAGAGRAPLARASGNGNGNGRPPSEDFADAATPVGQPDHDAVEAPKPKRTRAPRRASAPNGDAPGAPVAPSEASGASAALSGPPKAPTVDLCKAWVEAAAAAGYPAVPINGQHARTLADAWKAAGGDFAAVVRAVGAYFADRDAFVVRSGHAIGEFGRTSARWLAVAAGTAPSAGPPLSRQASAIGAAFDEAGRRLAAGSTPAPEEVDRFTDALPPDVASAAAAALPVTPW